MKNNEAMAKAIKAVINGDKQHSWGLEDSYQVILAIVANETGADIASLDTAEFGHLIKKVVNPSAFRQYLESDKVGLLTKSDKKAKEKDALAALLG